MKKHNQGTTAVISILFGGLGLQWFYIGRYTRALLFFFFSWTFIPAIWGFVQGIWWLWGKDPDEWDQQYNQEWLAHQEEKAEAERRHKEMMAQISRNSSN